MDTPIIAGIGEILFDVIGDSEELGGAPINFAYHVNMLGAKGYAVSTIGNDHRGRRALSELQDRQLATDFITVIEGYETGYVEARLDAAGVASYMFPDDIAWDHLTLNKRAMELAETVNAVCFGSLVQRSQHSRRELLHFLGNTPDKALKVFDVNLRQHFYTKEVVLGSLGHADILKLNDDELLVLAAMLDLQGGQRVLLEKIVAAYDLKLVALTRGDMGSILVTPGGFSEHPGIRTEHVADTIGAGDAFTAATVISFLKGYSLDDINEKANRVAAWVCSQTGAMPAMPETFRM